MKQKAVLIFICLSIFGAYSPAEPAAKVSAAVVGAAPATGDPSSGRGRPYSKEASHPGAPNLAAVLSRLEERMSKIKTLQTHFCQEKNLAIFDQKVILKGTISLQKPNLFAWHVNEPIRYSLIIKDTSAIQWDEDTKQIQHISLSKNTGYKIIAKQLKEWFSGTYSSMREQYDITILNSDPVCLKFDPRQDTMASKAVSSVAVTFDKDEQYIQKISIKEKNGDSTLLTFSNTQLNIPIGAAAWEAK